MVTKKDRHLNRLAIIPYKGLRSLLWISDYAMRPHLAQHVIFTFHLKGKSVMIINIALPYALGSSNRVKVQGGMVRIAHQESQLFVHFIPDLRRELFIVFLEGGENSQLFSHLIASAALSNSLNLPFLFASSASFSPLCHSSVQK